MPNATTRLCEVEGCTNKHLARGYCSTHYSTAYRSAHKKWTFTCEWCGKEYASGRKQQGRHTYCSKRCVRLKNCDTGRRQSRVRTSQKYPETTKTCALCGSTFNVGTGYQQHQRKYCTDKCKNKAHTERSKSQRSKLTQAIDEKDSKLFFSELKRRSKQNKAGCWIWQSLGADEYPRLKLRKRWVSLHRLTLEMKHGAPLGAQAAHHTCGDSRCVNPEHLQPVTHRDNVAEMLARHSYVRRIKELEQVVRALDPTNEVLNRIEVA